MLNHLFKLSLNDHPALLEFSLVLVIDSNQRMAESNQQKGRPLDGNFPPKDIFYYLCPPLGNMGLGIGTRFELRVMNSPRLGRI